MKGVKTDIANDNQEGTTSEKSMVDRVVNLQMGTGESPEKNADFQTITLSYPRNRICALGPE